MILDLMLYCAGFLLGLIAQILAALVNWVIPPEWHTITVSIFSYLSYLQGYIPFYPDPSIESGLARTIGLMTIVNWTIAFFVVWYSIKIFIKWVPLPHFLKFGIGNEVNTDGPLDLRSADKGQGRVVDLRRGPRKTRRYLRDIH